VNRERAPIELKWNPRNSISSQSAVRIRIIIIFWRFKIYVMRRGEVRRRKNDFYYKKVKMFTGEEVLF